MEKERGLMTTPCESEGKISSTIVQSRLFLSTLISIRFIYYGFGFGAED